MRKKINCNLWSVLFLRLILASHASAEDNRRASVVDIKISTEEFVSLFNEICLKNSTNLQNVRTIALSRDWKEWEGPFPYRHEQNQSTTLIAWAFWQNSVPYRIKLEIYDYTSPAVACNLTSFALDKSTIDAQMLRNSALKIRKRIQDEVQDVTLFDTENDPDLRIACSRSKPELLLHGECALVHVPAKPITSDNDKP